MRENNISLVRSREDVTVAVDTRILAVKIRACYSKYLTGKIARRYGYAR